MTQQKIILKVLEDRKDWTPSYDLIKVNTQWGWLGTSADRVCRKMVEDGIIESKHDRKYVYFKTKTPQVINCTKQMRCVTHSDYQKNLSVLSPLQKANTSGTSPCTQVKVHKT